MEKRDIVALSTIIVALVVIRTIFNIPNFNPIGAIALMGGILFRKRTTAFLITIGALFLGDIMLGLSSPTYMEYMFSTTFMFVYMSFVLGGTRIRLLWLLLAHISLLSIAVELRELWLEHIIDRPIENAPLKPFGDMFIGPQKVDTFTFERLAWSLISLAELSYPKTTSSNSMAICSNSIVAAAAA